MSICLHNPHSVLAAIETRPGDVLEIQVSPARHSEAAQASDPVNVAWAKVIRAARNEGITVRPGGKSALKEPRQGGRAGFPRAFIREKVGVSLETLLGDASRRAEGRGLWLALDCLQDPHNVGAIFRSASFFGVLGIVLTQERSAPLNSAVYDVASGGMEYVPFSVQTNLQRVFSEAKNLGLWILGTSEHAHDSICSFERDRPWMLVFGSEEQGMRRLTAENCDLLCKIPALGTLSSLNVAVAASVFLSQLTLKG